MDLFEELAHKCEIEYVSDLRLASIRNRIKKQLKEMEIKSHHLKEWNEVMDYIFGGKHLFDSYEKVEKFITEEM